jgi:hypothetical protein
MTPVSCEQHIAFSGKLGGSSRRVHTVHCEAARTALKEKSAAAAAAREAAPLTASLRKLELLKIRADAEATALPRSSLIISDEPLNRETNYHTEFVVVLNDPPQGGLAMRRRPADTARRNDGGFGWRGWGFPFDNTGRRSGQYYDPRQNGQNYYQWQQRWW